MSQIIFEVLTPLCSMDLLNAILENIFLENKSKILKIQFSMNGVLVSTAQEVSLATFQHLKSGSK